MCARRASILVLALAGWIVVGASTASATQPYARVAPVLSTPWTWHVSSTAPLPDYPRPQLERASWMNLNGQWQFEPALASSAPPFGHSLSRTILVPFPVQSPLSGIGSGDKSGWYRRTFRIPAGWGSRRVLLNFGAVSWAARVYVNRRLVGRHRGDYDGFSLDITRALRRGGSNELLVGYSDPVGGAGEPVGKQAAGPPAGFRHSASSGIWQTVWLEPVSPSHISGLELVPDVPHHRLLITATTTRARGLTLFAEALSGRRSVARASGPAARTLVLPIRRPDLWWPWRPFLYGLRLELRVRGKPVDRLRSYFAMRSIALGRVAGVTRVLLNGRFVFQSGALDQGMWPDGLYAAPTDGALRFDITAAERLGYNMLREHEKVQPDRWYMWADRLGLLVWQDMPAMPLTRARPPSGHARAEFKRELHSIVVELRSHPSIVTWVPFNEGWQQFDLNGVTHEVKRLDPSALVDTQSGSANCCDALESPASNFRDSHLYTGPFGIGGDRRASVIGEYGGTLPFPPRAHRWPGVLESVGSPALEWPIVYITGVLRRQYAMLGQAMRRPGISAAIFTELANYEQELGIISYDRRVFTIAPGLVRALNKKLIDASQRRDGVSPQRGAVPPGSTGAWSFDEGAGTSVADKSGSGHTLVLEGGATWTRGVHGSALLLHQAGATARSSAPVIDSGRSFSVSAWLRSDRAGQSGSAISQPGSNGSSFSLGIASTGPGAQDKPGQISSGIAPPALRSWWTFLVPASTQCPAARCGVEANMHYDDGRLSPAPYRWHAVTGVYDTSTESVSVYVDGIPQDVEHAWPLPASTGPLTVGAGLLDYVPTDTFTGAVDELRTYGRALTPAEVWQLYAAERPT